MNSAPVTIVVTFFDETAFLKTALQSIRAQNIEGLDLILVNDNPEQFSQSDLAKLGVTPDIRILQNPCNLGLSKSRNAGIRAARGTLIGFLDADDYYTTDGLKQQLHRAQDTGADITHAPCFLANLGSPDVKILFRDKALFGNQKTANGLIGAEEAQFIVSNWSSLYRTKFLRENNLYFDDEQTRFEDRIFVLQTVTRAKKITFHDTPTRIWRRRGGSITVTANTPDIHQLHLQLLEKCMAHIRNEVATGRLPVRFEKRELFNTVTRLIWDLDLIPAIVANDTPLYRSFGKRIQTLLGHDSFGQTVFSDPVLTPISRVNMKTRKGRITRWDFLKLHKAMREGDFQDVVAIMQGLQPSPLAPAKPREKIRQNLVLHLGLHKTGSTFIQHHLLHHQKSLLKSGILVPRTGQAALDEHALRPGGFPGHQNLLRANREGDTGTWDQLYREIRQSGARTVLISCENMIFATATDREKRLNSLFQHFDRFADIQAIAMLRRPDAYVESIHREWVCNGVRAGGRSIHEFLVDNQTHLTDLSDLFSHIESLTAKPVKFADFDAARAGNALWANFCTLAGLPSDLATIDAPTYPTPGRDTIVLLQLLNLLTPDHETRRRIIQGYFQLNPNSTTPQSLLSPDDRRAILNKFQTQSADFATARGYAPDFRMFHAQLAQEHWTPPNDVSSDLVTDLITTGTLALQPQLPPHTPKPKPYSPNATRRLRIRPRPWLARILKRL